MSREAKQPNHVLGKRTNCINFAQCPMCYGCRSYSTSNIECEKCTVNRKRDICNTSLHRSDLIEKLICRDEIKIEEEARFTSAIKGENHDK